MVGSKQAAAPFHISACGSRWLMKSHTHACEHADPGSGCPSNQGTEGSDAWKKHVYICVRACASSNQYTWAQADMQEVSRREACISMSRSYFYICCFLFFTFPFLVWHPEFGFGMLPAGHYIASWHGDVAWYGMITQTWYNVSTNSASQEKLLPREKLMCQLKFPLCTCAALTNTCQFLLKHDIASWHGGT